VKIKVGVGSLRNYQRMPYTFHGALGEFVDNSIQAYFDERKQLDKLLKKEKEKLHIRIDYDPQNNTLSVLDNSTGIKPERLTQAFEIGSVIQDRANSDSSLGQFNVGMKAAAIWMCDEWTITTKRYDSEEELKMVIVNEDVFSGHDEILEQKSKHHKKFKHHTYLHFEKLRQNPDAKTIDNTKIFLSSMYREFLGKSVFIYWGDELLEWEPFELRKKDNGKPYKWKFGPGTLTGDERERRVEGWIGILKSGQGGSAGRSRAGFTIMRRGRMIEGYPNGWRPESIFGTNAPNNIVNQRITGEIYFDDGDVSYDKSYVSDNDKIILNAYLGNFYLAEGIEEIAKQAVRGTKQEESVDPEKEKKELEGIKKTIEGSDLGEITDSVIAPDDIIKKRIDRSFKNAKSKDKYTFKIGSVKIVILPEYQNESDPFVAYKSDKKNEIKALINLQHPYTTTNMITRGEYFQFIVLMIISRYKIEIDERFTMDNYFEVLDQVMRLKINR